MVIERCTKSTILREQPRNLSEERDEETEVDAGYNARKSILPQIRIHVHVKMIIAEELEPDRRNVVKIADM